MFAKDQRARGHAYGLRRNDLVRQRILDDAVLVDARFVGEGVGAYDRFVGRDLRAGDFGEHAAGGEQVLEIDIRGYAEAFLAYGQRYDYFFQRSVAGPLADSVDGAFDLADAGAHRGQGVSNRHTEVVVTVSAQRDSLRIAEVFADAGEHRAVFFGHGIANRVGEIQRGGSRVDRYAANLAQEVDVRAAGVFGGEFHFADVLAAKANHRADRFQTLLARHVELDLEVQVGGGEENVQAGGRGGLQSFNRCADIVLLCAGECGDGNGAYLAGDHADGFEVATGRDGEAGFDDIDAQNRQLAGEADLFRGVHGKAGRLLAVAKRGVKDAYYVAHGGLLP